MKNDSDFAPIQLDSFLPYQIILLADLISRQTAAIAKAHNSFNQTQWRVMAAIAEKPGRTANEVVRVTPTDKGIVSRAVKSLLDMGIVTRKASQDDGRIGHLYLTSKGQRRYEKIATDVVALEQNLLREFPPKDKKAISEMLAMLTKNLT